MEKSNLQLSLFRGVKDTQPWPVTLDELVAMMRTDQSVRDLTDKHRYALSVGDKQSARRYKDMMLSFGIAALFEGGRRYEHITAFTGLSLVDIDHIAPEDMERVLTLVHADEHTLLAYVTMSGHGLRVLFRYEMVGGDGMITKEQYKQVFLHGNEYYSNLLGIAYDAQCKNPNRISTIAYDENLYYNPEATPFIVTIEEKKPVGRPRGGKSEKGRVKSCKVGEIESLVLRELEQRGVVYGPGTHNKYISDACYMMNRYGVSLDDCTAWALERFADYAATDDVPAIVRSCYQQTDEHGTAHLPRPQDRSRYATVGDMERFLDSTIRVRYNTIVSQPEWSPVNGDEAEQDAPWSLLTTNDLNSLWRRMSKHTGLTLDPNQLKNLLNSDYSPQYNPFEEFVAGLPEWDGVTDHIASVASMVTVRGEHDYFARCFKKWFVGFIAGLFDSEEVNHEILVLIGSQGKYKSTFFRHLLPPELRQYSTLKLMNESITKDELFKLAQMALVCLEEIDNMKQRELNQLKALTTMSTINERRAYGKFHEHLKHIASFCATGNNLHYLTDRTGNRRFLSFEVISIEVPQQHHYDYAGLYAQAYHLWRTDYRYWFDDEENAELDRHNRQFEEPCIEEELILTYLRHPAENEAGEFLTAARIIELVGQYVRTRLSPKRVAMSMNRLGFEPRRTKYSRGWIAVTLTGDEIKSAQRLNAHYSSKDE